MAPPGHAFSGPNAPPLLTTEPLLPTPGTRNLEQTPVAWEGGPGWRVAFWVNAVAVVGVIFVGCDTYLIGYPDHTKLKAAVGQLRMLTEACDEYKANNGDFPPSLAALAMPQPNGGPPLVSADHLVDPWGGHFVYDRAGLRNGGRHPDIGFNAPASERFGGVIGNWPGMR